MNARILDGLMGASTIVNTLGNRYLPISKQGSYAAWFKRGILPLLNCVNYNIRLAATPMGVYHQASAEGDSTLSQPQKKPSPGVDTVEIGEAAKAGQPQARSEVQPARYSAEGQVCPDTAEPTVSVSA